MARWPGGTWKFTALSRKSVALSWAPEVIARRTVWPTIWLGTSKAPALRWVTGRVCVVSMSSWRTRPEGNVPRGDDRAEDLGGALAAAAVASGRHRR